MQLNTEAQAVLDKIVVKSIPELSAENIAFLRARRSYLSNKQLDKYKSVLKDKTKIKTKK